jgi:hypothetical protein
MAARQRLSGQWRKTVKARALDDVTTSRRMLWPARHWLPSPYIVSIPRCRARLSDPFRPDSGQFPAIASPALSGPRFAIVDVLSIRKNQAAVARGWSCCSLTASRRRGAPMNVNAGRRNTATFARARAAAERSERTETTGQRTATRSRSAPRASGHILTGKELGERHVQERRRERR